MTRPLQWAAGGLTLGAVIAVSFAMGQQLRENPLKSHLYDNPKAQISLNEGNSLAMAADAQDDPNATPPAETFARTLEYVHDNYVDKVDDDQKLAQGAVRGMVASLDDPRARYYDPKDRKAVDDALRGAFHGIGAVLTVQKYKKNDVEYRRLVVVAAMPGSPAEQAGLRAGDTITHINGRWIIVYDLGVDIEKMRVEKKDDKTIRAAIKDARKQITDGLLIPAALSMLTLEDGKEMTLTTERAGAKLPPVKVTPKETKFEPVEFRTVNGVGVLRVHQFNQAATAQFTDALAKAGALKGLVIDLRDNPGGPMGDGKSGAGAYESALKLLSLTTPGGPVALVEKKLGKPASRETVRVQSAGKPAYKVVALVNRGTANLAEMTAKALRERAGGKLVGTRTFGDAMLQKMIGLRDGSAIILSTGRLLTPQGADYQGAGLIPDIAEPAPPAADNDPALNKALAALG